MLHTSVDFPSHIAVLLEAVFLAALLLIAAAWPRIAAHRGHGLLRLIPGLRSPRLLITVALGAFLGLAFTTWILGGHPIPGCPDEHAYLLAAETFSQGRLSNPPVFEPSVVAQHCLAQPVHQSKYPPGQSLVLTLGFLLGHPGYALWLQAALLAGTAAWCFAQWFPPRWALLASILLVLRLAVGSYWNQTYWGGSVAASAAFLLWGGAGCLLARRSGSRPARPLLAGLAIGTGLVLLALTRPYEGLVSVLPLAAWLLRPRALLRGDLVTLSTIAVLVASGLSLLAGYNHSITGNALEFPHQLYAESSTLPGEFVWQRFGTDGKLHWYEGSWQRDESLAWTSAAAKLMLRRAAQVPWFLLGPTLSVALLLLLAMHCGSRRGAATIQGRSGSRWLLAAASSSVLLVVVSHGLVEAYFPHYSAAATAPLWLLAVTALRQVTLRPPRFARWAPALVPIALALQLASTIYQVPAFRHDANDSAAIRHRLTLELRDLGGEHLVLVAPGHNMAVYNAPRPWKGAVVWAIEPRGAALHQLLERSAGRTLWRWRGEFADRLQPYTIDEERPPTQ